MTQRTTRPLFAKRALAGGTALGMLTATSAIAGISLDPIGVITTEAVLSTGDKVCRSSTAEIAAYEPRSKRLFAVNPEDDALRVFDLSHPANPVELDPIDVSDLGSPNSVAVGRHHVAVAIESGEVDEPGTILVLNRHGERLATFEAGFLPDMVTFAPDGRRVLVANEGQPNDDYTVDPEGSVTIIDLRRGVNRARVHQLGFEQFNDDLDDLRAAGVRIFGPGATVAQDVEPEYITFSQDTWRYAYVALQENNAFAVVDLWRKEITEIRPLGFKDHSLPGNEFDASDEDGQTVNIESWPVFGMYQPDAIAGFKVRGKTFIITANEGDARDYDGFSEEERVEDLSLDPTAFPDAASLQEEANLGRLQVTNTLGDTDGDGDFDELYAFGARSFTIFDAHGNLVYDSGALLERLTAGELGFTVDPDAFNNNNDENEKDTRSDAKGPEPEGVAVGHVDHRPYGFLGLERTGGVVAIDLADPQAPVIVDYVNTRDFSEDPQELPQAPAGVDPDEFEAELDALGDVVNCASGDLGPEGVIFIDAKRSPLHGTPLVLVTNEISGSIRIFAVRD